MITAEQARTIISDGVYVGTSNMSHGRRHLALFARIDSAILSAAIDAVQSLHFPLSIPTHSDDATNLVIQEYKRRGYKVEQTDFGLTISWT